MKYFFHVKSLIFFAFAYFLKSGRLASKGGTFVDTISTNKDEKNGEFVYGSERKENEINEAKVEEKERIVHQSIVLVKDGKKNFSNNNLKVEQNHCTNGEISFNCKSTKLNENIKMDKNNSTEMTQKKETNHLKDKFIKVEESVQVNTVILDSNLKQNEKVNEERSNSDDNELNIAEIHTKGILTKTDGKDQQNLDTINSPEKCSKVEEPFKVNRNVTNSKMNEKPQMKEENHSPKEEKDETKDENQKSIKDKETNMSNKDKVKIIEELRKSIKGRDKNREETRMSFKDRSKNRVETRMSDKEIEKNIEETRMSDKDRSKNIEETRMSNKDINKNIEESHKIVNNDKDKDESRTTALSSPGGRTKQRRLSLLERRRRKRGNSSGNVGQEMEMKIFHKTKRPSLDCPPTILIQDLQNNIRYF